MGQALRIDGITPAAVYILLSHLKKKVYYISSLIDLNFIKNSKISIQNVSRETLDELNKYSLSILKKIER